MTGPRPQRKRRTKAEMAEARAAEAARLAELDAAKMAAAAEGGEPRCLEAMGAGKLRRCPYRDPRTGQACGASQAEQYCPEHRGKILPVSRGPLAHTTLRVAPGSRNGRRGV